MKCADEVSLGNRFWEGKYVQRTCSLIGAWIFGYNDFEE